MKFLLDANMPRAALAVLQAHGHEAEHVRDIALANAADPVIAAHARTAGAVLVSRDLDFADTRRYPPEDYAGLLLLRLPDQDTAAQVADTLSRFLDTPKLVSQLPGHLVVLESSRVRFRPPLENP
ncbi:MAG: DUF5615 family PIN-like protein [Rudaea sp.]|uniref:DUF5615 family PIN-like protein n=1 Tax=Rudaea sp. TaxID=2136325 RepID=UPI0039E4F2DE